MGKILISSLKISCMKHEIFRDENENFMHENENFAHEMKISGMKFFVRVVKTWKLDNHGYPVRKVSCMKFSFSCMIISCFMQGFFIFIHENAIYMYDIFMPRFCHA